jgi:hypothetical protein
MKNVTAIYFLFLFTLGISAMTAPNDPIEATAWYLKMEQGIENWAYEPNKSKQIDNLADYVFKFGHKMPNHPDLRWQKLYFKAQTTLLSIPGHAQYYDKIIRSAYADFKDQNSPKYAGSVNRVQREMELGFKTLRHLPSPETVQVMGDMLAEEWQRPPIPGYDYIPPAMAIASVHSLAMLPFRESPTPPFASYLARENLPIWQQWYAEVKSGKRTFSFKGQNVDYRFKPDGTWDTISLAKPPDDGPKPPTVTQEKQEQLEKQLPQQHETNKPQTSSNVWAWVIGIVMVLLAGLAWFRGRNQKPRADR